VPITVRGQSEAPGRAQTSHPNLTRYTWNSLREGGTFVSEGPATARRVLGQIAVQTDPPDILIAEDECLIGSLVEEALGEAGFNASLVVSGEEALTLLNGSKAKYRALVTDINFGEGEMRGWELARLTREMHPEFPIIYISGGSPEDWISKGVRNSILVAKPFSAAEIITALSQLLNTVSSRT